MVAFANELGMGGMIAAGIGPWWRLSGVMHPAVAHFPIALLMVAALIESWSVLRRHRKPSQTALVCLYIGAIAAVVASVLGWANADASGEKGDTFNLHKWLGIGVAALAVVSVILSLVARRENAGRKMVWSYRGGVFAAAALVGLVGSFGGKLVHGDSYYSDALAVLRSELSEGAVDVARTTVVKTTDVAQSAIANAAAVIDKVPAPLAGPVPPEAISVATSPATQPAVVAAQPTASPAVPDIASPAVTSAVTFGGGQIDYARDIEPILQANCVKCHNERKKKGDYRVDAYEHLFAGGESGAVAIVPGKSDQSLLVKVIEGKNEYADSIMPPKGDPLTFQQIALIRRWIDEGARTAVP